MSDYEQYLIEQQAERGRVYNDMTLDERLTEFIEHWNNSTERALAIDAHLEIIKLRRERDNLVAELAAARELLKRMAACNPWNDSPDIPVVDYAAYTNAAKKFIE